MHLVGVVEIGGDPTLLFVGAVFILTFLAVATIAWLMLRTPKGGSPASTWNVQLQTRLPVSQAGFEQMSRATKAATRRPAGSPASRAQLDRLAASRDTFVSVYRVLMILSGLAGLIGGALLLRSHTPGNMNGLPGGIIVLVSLGVLLKGLMPGPSVRPVVDPIDPGVLDEIKRKVNVQVSTGGPLRVTLSEADSRRAAELLGRDVPLADVAREFVPGYDDLSEFEQQAIAATFDRIKNLHL